ncbi:hypothetical protein [Lewinella sp. IMCC34191]|uniref:hypothetical protein n=1 Tax=Lewinella sp. IMCC34191 TaxID=2259172 RepID=UPI000E28203D|nr:hypothetical protein [Lewinella sp. IMCC34191]
MYNGLKRRTALSLSALLLFQSFLATPAYGLSGGPTQPEFRHNQIVGADNLVDAFTGNFNYSIPLFEMGGYPINLTYASDHKMEDEASWVGAGWTLNPGVISRQVRGLPDDFRGEEVVHRGNMRSNITTGVSPSIKFELFGIFGISPGINLSYNNYAGYNLSTSISPSVNVLAALNGEFASPFSKGKQKNDASPTPLKSFAQKAQQEGFSSSLSANFSSRSGLQSVSFNTGFDRLSSSISRGFGGFTYTPVGELPRVTNSVTFEVSGGLKIFWPDATMARLAGYYVEQRLSRNVVRQPSFGYLYLEDATDEAAVMDYNVEKAGALDENTHRLPIAFGTPDAYAISGMGVTGNIEVTRNDLGEFRPSRSQNSALSGSAGVEGAFGNLVHAAVNVEANVVSDTRGGWTAGNGLRNQLSFRRNRDADEFKYLRLVGESSNHLSSEYYAAIGEDQPITGSLERGILSPITKTFGLRLQGDLKKTLSTSTRAPIVQPVPSLTQLPNRRPRATHVSYLTAAEAVQMGLHERIVRYRPWTESSGDFGSLPSYSALDRWSEAAGRKGHHISEISVTSPSGQSFVYGLPVYNTRKEEVTFSVSAENTDPTSSLASTEGAQTTPEFGTISYAGSEEDITVANDRGFDHYFDQIETPAHPIAHLLTAALSPDYVDRTDDGPTQDDGGDYLKIGYTPLVTNNDQNANVGWRTPMGEYRAVLHEGNSADPDDDKASFVYGEKEIYYVHHMDSRTHRAVFFTSDRDDALPVNRHGVVETSAGKPRLQKLDSIKIFTLASLREFNVEADALKTVHFSYAPTGSASQISGNLPNATAGGGKLTLQSISFTYADNERGKEHPYLFDYRTDVVIGGDTTKATYQPFLVDRWGTQRPALTEGLDPIIYPYSVQDKAIADTYSSLGNLKRILLPSGGNIEIEYEADDYAYVHASRAGQMYKIAGFSESFKPSAAGISEDLYRQSVKATVPYLYTYIDVGTIPGREGSVLPDRDELRRLYLEDVEQLYFSSAVTLFRDRETTERVTGYADFDPDFLEAVAGGGASGGDLIVLRLRGLTKNNRETERSNSYHPFTYAALEKMRLEMPRLLYEEAPTEGYGTPAKLFAAFEYVGTSLQNYFARRTGRNNARSVDLPTSFVRLADADFGKYGDGSRVSRIILDDAWAPDQTRYVKRYTYTREDELTGEIISSGVASNEPMIGKEEMLYVNQEKSVEGNFLAPDETYYSEAPLGLQFYPGAQVGYSRVTVTAELEEVYQQSQPGTTVFEYFTTRDFPVVAKATRPDRKRINPFTRLLPFVSRVKDYLAYAQGFVIQTNDMHGKQKASYEYDAGGSVISSTVYHYLEQPSAGGVGSRLLNNKVDLVNQTGSGGVNAVTGLLGIDLDVWTETTEVESNSFGGGVQINGETSVLPFPPFPLAGVFSYPQITRAETSVRTATTTKLIRRYGILDRVEVTNNGSSLATVNHRWDGLTGQVLLSSIQNEFDQPVYTQNLPAYWMEPHRGMQAAYRNQGVEFQNTIVKDGRLWVADTIQVANLIEGDEVICYLREPSRQRHRFYATMYKDSIRLIDELGKLGNTVAIPTNSDAYVSKILSSGNRNQVNAKAGQTVSLNPPTQDEGWWSVDLPSTSVLSSNATVYLDDWALICDSIADYSTGTPIDTTSNCESGFSNVVQRHPIVDEGECTVDNYNWAELKDSLCPSDCEELFFRYADFLLIADIWEYIECTSSNTYRVYQNDETWVKIRSCEFLDNGNNIHMRSYSGTTHVEDIHVTNAGMLCSSDGGDIVIDCSQRGLRQVSTSEMRLELQTPDLCAHWKPGDQNPYLLGERGNWRPQANYVYKETPRGFSTVVSGPSPIDDSRNNYTQPLIYTDGTFVEYLPFWFKGEKYQNGASHQLQNRVTKYDEKGHDISTQDALGIHSGAQYAHGRQLPVSVAQNAKFSDIGFDGFEDYLYTPGAGDERWERHFGMLGSRLDVDAYRDQVVNSVAHTGKHSVAVTGGGSAIVQSFATNYCDPDTGGCDGLQDCDCIAEFAPRADSTYLVSAWVASSTSILSGRSPASLDGTAMGINNPSASAHLSVTASIGGSTFDVALAYAQGPIVDGWQQISVPVTIPANAEQISIRIEPPQSSSGTQVFYFDDIRVQPYQSEMTSYVYDPHTLRLMAQLDDRGYAVYYEYDDEGMLIRQKRETERGIMTITEQHSNIAPQNRSSR